MNILRFGLIFYELNDKLKDIENNIKDLEKQYNDLCVYYCEDPKTL
jgi:hypothetical protein